MDSPPVPDLSPKPSPKRRPSYCHPSHNERPLLDRKSSITSAAKRPKYDELEGDRYSQIEEHGVIGNLRTCALISVTAEVCWFCYPNFDSPSIFACILDKNKGGHWSIRAFLEDEGGESDTEVESENSSDEDSLVDAEKDSPSPPLIRRNDRVSTKRRRSSADKQREYLRRYVTHKQLYHSETNVLVSRFLSDDGVGQVMDWMPVGKVKESARGWLMRELYVVRGKMCFQVEIVPAFNYGRDSHTIVIEAYGARFISNKLVMEVRTNRILEWELTEDNRGVMCFITLHENEKEVFIFSESVCCPAGHYRSIDEERIFDKSAVQKEDFRPSWNEGDPTLSVSDDDEEEEQTATMLQEQQNIHNNSFQQQEEKKQNHEQQSSQNDPTAPKKPPEKAHRIGLGEIVWKSTGSLPDSIKTPPRVRHSTPSSRATTSHRAHSDETQSSTSGSSSSTSSSSSSASNSTTPAIGSSPTSNHCSTDKLDEKEGQCDCHHFHTQNAAPTRAAIKREAEKKKAAQTAIAHKSSHTPIKDQDVEMQQSKETTTTTTPPIAHLPQQPPIDDASEDDTAIIQDRMITITPASLQTANQLKLNTIAYWRDWIGKCTYNGRWREVVYRSALVLKLMTFEPTGAIVAALTTSLPEEIGGERNWDYRFTWIRDSSFTLYAFLKLGFKAEASAFMSWISQRCEESSRQDGSLQIMYGLHGEHKLKEKHLDHLVGYKNSGPVRIGNNAYDQVQLDIYGELLDTVYLSNKYAEPISYDFWKHVRKMVDWMCEHWHEDDEGVWETRAGKKPFVYSKMMAWVAVDRGIRLAEKRSFPADLTHWQRVRNEIYEEIQQKGWNEQLKAYTQSYGSDTLDASVLMMPLVFFTAPTDPRFISTLDAILKNTNEGGLVSNNLVFRYNVQHCHDGLLGQEGTFSICTFWAVEAAARLGAYRSQYLETARFMFEQMLGYANHLGLYSEEIGKRGEHLGNFPQAFTHLALISAAINLDRALNASKTPNLNLPLNDR